MTDLVYDGSFDGFLCALARRGGAQGTRIVAMEERVAELFGRETAVVTDPAMAARFAHAFAGIAGAEELETLLLVHASGDPRRHELLREYAAMTLAAGRSVADRMGVPVVLAVQKLRGRVTWEIGKLLGFIRFRGVADGSWYAPVEPRANIVGFLGPHFTDRFPGQRFLIHDTGRDLGWCCAGGVGGIVDLRAMPESLRESLARDVQPLVQDQWRAYFDAVAIPERRNPRLQDHNMPRRYWKHLIEQPGCAAMRGERKDLENEEGDVRGTCRGCSL